MNTPRFNSVDEALASLPRSVQPTRDLWPAIARQIDERGEAVVEFKARPVHAAPRTYAARWSLALAASLAVVGLVAALCWSVLQGRPAAGLVASNASPASANAAAAAAAPSSRTLVNFEPMHNADYVAARTDLERVFNERLQLLAPATRARVQADLETIRKANEDIRAALAKDPASPLLLKLLQNTGQQEIDLYTSVAQTTEPMLSRRT